MRKLISVLVLAVAGLVALPEAQARQASYWTQQGHVPDAESIRTLLAFEEGILYAGTERGCYLSADEGAHWVPAMLGTGFRVLSPELGRTALAGTDFGKIYRIDASGAWTKLHADRTDMYVYAFAFGQDGHVFAGTRFGVLRSADEGATWAAVGQGWPGEVRALAVTLTGDLLAGTARGLFRSSDVGETWTAAGLAGRSVLTLSSAGTALLAGTGQGVYRSADGGRTWTAAGLEDRAVYALAVDRRGSPYAATDRGVYRRDAGSEGWQALHDAQLGGRPVATLAFGQDGTLYAGTPMGFVFRSAAATATAREEEPVPSRFALAQNYPNPFNPATTIAFELAEGGPVQVRVLDLRGRMVATLFSGTLPAGRHTVFWAPAGLPSGVYVYQIETRAFRQARRLVLLQ